MGQGHVFDDPIDTLSVATSRCPNAICPASSLSAENNFLLNKLGRSLQGGSVQQAFIHACCAQRINA